MFKFETLNVWKKAIAYSDKILEITDELPQRYQFSLGDQLRRAGISVPTNIAEANGRNSIKETNQLYNVARGSAYETVNLLRIALNRKLIEQETYDRLYKEAEEIARMLSGLMKKNAN
ncbi:MAG: four helix bundle protein [Patescibacteria group bacterium]